MQTDMQTETSPETTKVKIAMYKNLLTPNSAPMVTWADTWIEESGSGYRRISDIIEVELRMLPEDEKAELEGRLETARVAKEKADREYAEIEKRLEKQLSDL